MFVSEKSRIWVTIPVIDELDYLPSTLEAIKNQKCDNFHVVVCVNQPDEWWDNPEKKHICQNNQKTLEYLAGVKGLPLTIIDKTSPGNGWKGKNHGVGQARRTIMDAASATAKPEDIILSLDADTLFNPGYFDSVKDNLARHPKATALSVPYYHRLTDEEAADRAILRYEIYMRYYRMNMLRIGSPYSFTALGSAIAVPVWAYRAIGGITPKLSGEDFYFLQKLCKFGTVLTWNSEKVFPAARFSDRVYFGTGPAMIKGSNGDWESYPVYDYRYFDDILLTYNALGRLYEEDIETPLDAFLHDVFKENNIWEPLRRNAKSLKTFIKACHDKVDGLRILQYLKAKQKEAGHSDDKNLVRFLKKFYPACPLLPELSADDFSLNKASVALLNKIRDFLAGEEEKMLVHKHQNYPE